MRALAVLLVLTLASVASADEWSFRSTSGVVIPGAPLEEIGALATQVGRVRKATLEALGVDIGRVPVHVVTIDELRRLHDEMGGRLPHGFLLYGFELKGHVFVRHALGGIPDEVIIHECLHALSERFAQQVHMMSVGKIIEGITQYFTLEAMAARPKTGKLVATKNRTYVAFTELAESLATLVGEAQLRSAYFEGGLMQLAVRVDAATHGRRVLEKAARALEDGDEHRALALLGGG